MKQIGTKLYYCLNSGNKIITLRDVAGDVVETTFEEDYEIYVELSERNKSTIGLLKFEYGEYAKLSEGATSVRVDLETKKPIFSYEELPMPPQEPTLEDVIREQGNKISILEQENANLKASLQTTQEAVDFMLMGGI